MRPLIDEAAIAARVAELGRELSAEYRDRPLTVIGVLTGCIPFLADLVRAIDVPHRIGVVQASSYRGRTTVAGALHVDIHLLPDLRGRDVLVIDDIFDTGNTLQRLVAALAEHEPASVRTAVLMVKEGRSEVRMRPDWFCFRIPDAFVVGYGLDYNDDYRHLPGIHVLEETV